MPGTALILAGIAAATLPAVSIAFSAEAPGRIDAAAMIADTERDSGIGPIAHALLRR